MRARDPQVHLRKAPFAARTVRAFKVGSFRIHSDDTFPRPNGKRMSERAVSQRAERPSQPPGGLDTGPPGALKTGGIRPRLPALTSACPKERPGGETSPFK